MTNDLGVEVPYGGAKDCLGVAAVVEQDAVEALLAHEPDEVLRVRHRPPPSDPTTRRTSRPDYPRIHGRAIFVANDGRCKHAP
jgi:hypothetical protein